MRRASAAQSVGCRSFMVTVVTKSARAFFAFLLLLTCVLHVRAIIGVFYILEQRAKKFQYIFFRIFSPVSSNSSNLFF